MMRITWVAPEYHHTEKSRDWYIALIIITVSLVGASFLLDNPLFAVFIALAAGSVALFSKRLPDLIPYELSEKGIAMGAVSFPYHTLESFCISEGDQSRLLIKSKKLVSPLIVVPLGDTDINEVGELLRTHLAEEELSEPFLAKLLERAGF